MVGIKRMTIRNHNLDKKLELYLNEVAIRRNDDFLENEFTRNCLISTRFGTSFSTFEYRKLLNLWYQSFTNTKCIIKKTSFVGDIVSCSFSMESMHTGHYCGVEETGKSISMDGVCDVLFLGNSISFASNIVDNSGILRQISQDRYSRNSDTCAPLTSVNIMTRFLLDAQRYFRFIGLHLSLRQLEVLSLWMTARTRSEIASILGISKNTVDCYQANLRDTFRCSQKHIIYDQLIDMNMIHVVNQCKFFLCSHKGKPEVYWST